MVQSARAACAGALLCLCLFPGCSREGAEGTSRAVVRAGCFEGRRVQDRDDVVTASGGNARNGSYKGEGAPLLRRRQWKVAIEGAETLLGAAGKIVVQGVNETVALHAQTGRARWRLATDGKLDALTPAAAAFTGETEVVVVDLERGTQHWRAALPGGAYAIGSTFIGSEVVTFTERSTHFFDATTGSLNRSTRPLAVTELPAVADGVAYLTWESKAIAVELSSGETRWTHADLAVGSTFASPSVACGAALFVNYLDTVALDAATGAVRWRVETIQERNLTATVGGRTAVIPTGIDLVGVDASSGQERWRIVGIGEVSHPPAFAAGTLYVVATSYTEDEAGAARKMVVLHAIDAATGSETGRTDIGTSVVDGPIIVGASVLLITEGGTVHSFVD